jgi:DNA-binding beta-propeller fold protein YncE
MTRRITMMVAVLGLALVGLGGGARAARGIPGASGTVFVTERQFGTASAFDAASGEALWTAAVGASPIGIVQPRGTDKVYTSDEGPDQLTVLDRRTGAWLATIPMGPDPHHLNATADGTRIFVAEFGRATIGVVDTALDARVAGFTASLLPDARTHAVWITEDGRDLYATNTRVNRALPGDVARLDAATGALLCNVVVGMDPSEILVTKDGLTGYVSVRRENKVKELDLAGPCPALTGREALVGTMPDTLRLTNNGQTLVVALRGTPLAQVTLLDTHSFATQTVTIPGHTTTGHQWLSANGRYTFVAVETPAGLAVIDNDSGAVLADYLYPTPPGGTRAHGVFYVPEVLR